MKKRWMICMVWIVAAATVPLLIAESRGGTKFRARLTGFQEVPTLSSTGSGEVEGRIDKQGTSISFRLTYEDLETPVSAAHIHLGARGTNGGVILFFCGGGGRPACPMFSGTVEGTATAADVVGPAAQGIAPGELREVIRAIRAGFVYANVHTSAFPGGEIRGQLQTDEDHHHDD